jgi:hypothetical protein
MKYRYSNHAASDAALEYLLEDSARGFDNLMGCCFLACKGLYFPDLFTPYNQSGTQMLGQNGQVRDFVLLWLLEELKPHRGMSGGDIQRQEPKLRHLPRRARLAVLAVIRNCPACGKRKTKKCLYCGRILTHKEVNTRVKNCPECGIVLAGNHTMVCPRGCSTPSCRTSLDQAYLREDPEAAPLSGFVVQSARADVAFEIESLRPDLNALHPDLCDYLKLAYEHFANDGRKRDLTATLAKDKGLSHRAALKLRNNLGEIIRENVESPVLSALYAAFARDSRGVPYLAVDVSRQTKFAMEAKREATERLRQSCKELGLPVRAVKRMQESPSAPDCADPDDSRGSTVTFVSANSEMRKLAVQDILEHIREADYVSDEDIAEYYDVESVEELTLKSDFLTDQRYAGQDIAYDEETGYDEEIN